MRYLSKGCLVAICLLVIGAVASSVSANTLLAGSFTLDHPTQVKSTTLPAGQYTFKLARTQTDTNLLSIHGKNQALDILIFAQYACATCKNGALKLDVAGDNRVATSLDLPGFHVDFNSRRSRAQNERQSAKVKAQPQTEQVAVHVNPN